MSLPARIERKIVRVPFCGCWIWIGAGVRYGHVWFEGRLVPAHRLIYRLSGNALHDGQDLLHRCDTGPCVNPDHLQPGSHAENMADMVKKGRSRTLSGDQHWTRSAPERAREIARRNIAKAHASGEANANAKATLAVAASLRAMHAANPRMTLVELGAKFGLGKETARKILKGIAWHS